MTQKERVVRYINEFGSITRLEAIRDLGIADLPSVIRYLRQDGINVIKDTKVGVNRWGENTTYGVYTIMEENKDGNKIPSREISSKNLWGCIRAECN